VRLTCRATIEGTQVPVTWMKKGNQPLSSRFIEEFPGVVALTGATLEDVGEYECQVGEFSASTRLEVHKPPKITLEPNTEQLNVTEGDDVQFKCSAEGDPKPTLEMTTPSGEKSTSADQVSADLPNIQINQSGTYVCKAKNGAGQDTKSVVVNVGRKKNPIEPESSESTTEIVLTTTTPRELTTTTKVTTTTPKTTTTTTEKITTTSRATATTKLPVLSTTQMFEPRIMTDPRVPSNGYQYGPPQNIPYKIILGERAEINCRLQGSTVGTNWRRSDGSQLPQSARAIGGNLVIENVGLDANGNYDCFINDQFRGPITVLIAHVLVAPGPPQISFQAPKTVALGDDVSIVCLATGEGPIRTQWSCDGRQGFPA
jgi:hypothetical protein